ncbi:MAG: hypothetical protein Q7T17_11365 [Microbacterium sp.]|uniref:hypothetical protein n=1 Tax=Microbacterium sp. TaxID=51671 RepID=UPI002727F50B|nr:hypothetical protein [Microbacterium sp.]MDO8383559.1 hypothetical protein [Microbacterium sp.]|tara:strand:- start:3572 stop:4483 length:912 start_codon:yes stop_codon:yes gene_type:complete
MGGQVLGGGVILLVAVALWLVYLVPTWHSRHQYYAAERNAVRLNQAIRVLAETSETPGEVRLELNARTALQQQRLARRLQAEHQSAELEELREQVAHARSAPLARRARARRRARLVATTLLLVGLSGTGFGIWQVVQGGAQTFLWAGAASVGLSLIVLQRMAHVAARAAVADSAAEQPVAVRREASVQDLAPAMPQREWTPRTLPQPLVSSNGSRAAAQLDAADAREALRRAAREEALRTQIERQQTEPSRPQRIDRTVARVEAQEAPAASVAPARSPYAGMGVVDDAEIEAHVRALLRQRAG